MDDLECPYCNADLEVNHDDGFGYEESTPHEMECGDCGKSFVFYTSVSFYYEPQKADCLNDGKHDYKLQNGYPKALMRMECSMCGDERQPTLEERKKLGIPTREEFFKSLHEDDKPNSIF